MKHHILRERERERKTIAQKTSPRIEFSGSEQRYQISYTGHQYGDSQQTFLCD